MLFSDVWRENAALFEGFIDGNQNFDELHVCTTLTAEMQKKKETKRKKKGIHAKSWGRGNYHHAPTPSTTSALARLAYMYMHTCCCNLQIQDYKLMK